MKDAAAARHQADPPGRDLTGARHEAGHETAARSEEARRVRPEQSHAGGGHHRGDVGLVGPAHSAGLGEPAGADQRRPGAGPGRFGQGAGGGGGRHAQHGQVDRRSRRPDRLGHAAVHARRRVGPAVVDQQHRPGKRRQRPRHRRPQLGRVGRRPDDADAPRREQRLQPALCSQGHWRLPTRSVRPDRMAVRARSSKTLSSDPSSTSSVTAPHASRPSARRSRMTRLRGISFRCTFLKRGTRR